MSLTTVSLSISGTSDSVSGGFFARGVNGGEYTLTVAGTFSDQLAEIASKFEEWSGLEDQITAKNEADAAASAQAAPAGGVDVVADGPVTDDTEQG